MKTQASRGKAPWPLMAILGFGLTGCETYTSTGQDDSSYAQGNSAAANDPAAVRLAAARAVLSSSRCLSCHAPDSGISSGRKWTASFSEQQWVANGLVVAGNPSSSTLFIRIRNPSGGGGNMPPTGNLTPSEYDAIQEWITKMIP